jgi:uncharacterized protein (DUF427 family)
MRAIWNGLVLAESEATREVGGYVYFPRASVRMDLLRAAARTTSDDECPHGVQFYDVVDGARSAPRNAWSYERPGAGMREIERWLGFWDEVEVVA